jgi:hypothetical protein
MRDLLTAIIAKSLAALQEIGELPEIAVPPIEVRPWEHGVYVTDIAIRLADALRATGQPQWNPQALAESIAAYVRETVAVVPAYDMVEKVIIGDTGIIALHVRVG